MASLLREVVDSGVPPWQARLPMTPEEVAASYEQADEEYEYGQEYGDADFGDPGQDDCARDDGHEDDVDAGDDEDDLDDDLDGDGDEDDEEPRVTTSGTIWPTTAMKATLARVGISA